MTSSTIKQCTIFLSLIIILANTSLVNASEVTGSLSSNAVNQTEINGAMTGTVSSPSRSSGSSNSGSRSTGGVSSAPTGSVLGAAANTIAPNFPNAGADPKDRDATVSIWTILLNFLHTMISF